LGPHTAKYLQIPLQYQNNFTKFLSLSLLKKVQYARQLGSRSDAADNSSILRYYVTKLLHSWRVFQGS